MLADGTSRDLSIAAGAHHRRLPGRRAAGHHRAPDRAVAVGAARPAVPGREQARRRRHLGAELRRQFAAGRLHALAVRTAEHDRRHALRQAQVEFRARRRAGRRHQPGAAGGRGHPGLPVKSIPELIAYAKANPGKINYASAGVGTPQHVAGELFKMMTGVVMQHVPYRGSAPALTDLLGGQVQLMIETTPASLEHIRAGRLRGLAVTTLTRAEALPDLPTVADFVPGYEAISWYGIAAAEEHAARDRRQAQQGDQRRSRRPQFEEAAGRPGRHRSARLARRLRQVHRRRNREMGQGGPGRQHEGRIGEPPRGTPAKHAGTLQNAR